MPKIKTSLSLVGSYMCKNLPIVVFNVSSSSEKQILQKYLFNTPPDIQRNLYSQFAKMTGSETIMFTNFSHQALSGLVSLILSLYDRRSKNRLNLKIYGTQKHWDYLQNAKFHLGQKVFGVSYASWLIPQYHRMGVVDQELYNEIMQSDKFADYVWRMNWRMENEPKEKINDSREYMKGKNEYYEDQYMVMRPFFENNPKSELKRHKGSKYTQKNIKEYMNSSTHFLCICKHQEQQQQAPDEDGPKQRQGDSNAIHFQPATLIITYRSVEQIGKILARSDKVQGVNKDLGLLDFIEMNLKGDKAEGNSSRIHLKSIVHIISTSSLVHSQQFHHLFTTLDNICYPSSTPATHLFYGHGIKSSTTNIHHLMNTYYRGARFYSICSKLFKYIPNITHNHLNYWSKIFDKDFANVCAMLDQRGANINGSLMEVYKPIHNVTVYSEQSAENPANQSSENKDQFYSVSAELLAQIKYPLFSTSTQYQFTKQLKFLYSKKATFENYNPKKAKIPKGKLISKIKQIKQFDPKVIFLGTNSKSPNQLRNVSGILLELPHDNTETLFILDCGAGTYEQFVYQYAPEELEKKLMSLKVIFLTHLHADHNLGIVDLIKKRNDLIKQKGLALEDHKLFVILPFNTLSWFYGYCKGVQNVNEGCEILLTQSLTGEKINLKDDFFQSRKCAITMQRIRLSPGKLFTTAKTSSSTTNQPVLHGENSNYADRYIRFGSYEDYLKSVPEGDLSVLKDIFNEYGHKQEVVKEMFEQLLAKMKLKKFMPSKVFHCPFSYGVVIEHNNGIKISYSGDCRPTPEFLQHAQNSTLLIHEATYESNQQDKAIYKLHSTFQQAVEACISSKSDHVALTHFKPGAFDRDTAQTMCQPLYKPEVIETYRKKAIIACDFLSFNLSEAEEVVKASKIISNIGKNSIIQKSRNPFSSRFIYEVNKQEEEEREKQD